MMKFKEELESLNAHLLGLGIMTLWRGRAKIGQDQEKNNGRHRRKEKNLVDDKRS